MAMHRVITKLLLSGALLLLLAGASLARERVSIQGGTVNMRAGPSRSAEVLWQLGRGYPLAVLGRKGSWIHVVDFENDKGWVAARLTSRTPHVIVRSPSANVRKGPGTRHRVLRRAEYGEVFRILDRRKSWVRVRGEDGRTGWIARGLLWGS